MRTTIVVLMLLALPAAAQYKFHVRVTDARTALLANPKFDELKMPAEQLERAANDRVLLFDHATGAHWIWLMMSVSAKEAGVNVRGGAAPGKGADVAFTPNDDGTLRLRCLHEQCRIRVTTADGKTSETTLANDESANLPLDADYELTF